MLGLLYILGFLAGSSFAAQVAADPPESELRKIAADLDKLQRGDPKATALLKAGARIVNGPGRPPIEDELAFLVAAGNKSKFPEDAKRFEELLSLFLNKPRQAEAEQARIMRCVARYYWIRLDDSKKRRELLLQAEKLHEKAQVDQAKDQVETWLELGKAHLAERPKALAYFKRVLDFPLYDEPYNKEKKFKELYAEAAVQTVKLTDNASLSKLRLHPVGRAAVARWMPDKAELINEEIPFIADFRAKVITWLELTAKEEKANGNIGMQEHIDAVLKHLRAQNR
jgi:hypothetical protein